jgi:hypothetical protein
MYEFVNNRYNFKDTKVFFISAKLTRKFKNDFILSLLVLILKQIFNLIADFLSHFCCNDAIPYSILQIQK